MVVLSFGFMLQPQILCVPFPIVEKITTTFFLFLSQEVLQDESRQKMALASRVRALEEEKNGLMERLEEEEERAKELTRQIQTQAQQVSQWLTQIE